MLSVLTILRASCGSNDVPYLTDKQRKDKHAHQPCTRHEHVLVNLKMELRIE